MSTPDEELINIATLQGRKHAIHFIGYINEEHLAGIYSLASLFVYPSTYEGFGLPPLESLSCETPVIVSKSSSLPEVVGNHALFVNPRNHNQLSSTLTRWYKNELEAPTNIKQAAQYARSFSWKKMAQQTVSCYENCFD